MKSWAYDPLSPVYFFEREPTIGALPFVDVSLPSQISCAIFLARPTVVIVAAVVHSLIFIHQ